jgi:hypothetical protein
MATFGCNCGFVMHLSQGGNNHEFNLIRESIIEDARRKINSGEMTSSRIFDLVNMGKCDVLLCTECDRLHIQIDGKNTFTPYTRENNKVECACVHDNFNIHDFEIIWEAKIQEVSDRLYDGERLSEKIFDNIISEKRLLVYSCRKCGRLWVRKAGEAFVPYVKEFQQSETPAIFLSD